MNLLKKDFGKSRWIRQRSICSSVETTLKKFNGWLIFFPVRRRKRVCVNCDMYSLFLMKKNIPSVVIIGDEELQSETAKIKNLKSGIQSEVPFRELISVLTDEKGKLKD